MHIDHFNSLYILEICQEYIFSSHEAPLQALDVGSPHISLSLLFKGRNKLLAYFTGQMHAGRGKCDML